LHPPSSTHTIARNSPAAPIVVAVVLVVVVVVTVVVERARV